MYGMGNTWFGNDICEKDLGILIDYSLNLSQPCVLPAKKTNAVVGCINRCTVSKPQKVIIAVWLYTTCVQFLTSLFFEQFREMQRSLQYCNKKDDQQVKMQVYDNRLKELDIFRKYD